MSLLQAHLVFVAKYRRRVFTDAMLTYTEITMRSICDELVEFNGEADHVHLLIAPTLAISVLAHRLKGRTSHAVRREYTRICVRGSGWTPLVAVLLRRLLPRAHPCPSSSNTSTDKPTTLSAGLSVDKPDGLTAD